MLLLFSHSMLAIYLQVFKWVEPRRQLDWHFRTTRILPVGFFMALTLHFGNVVYLYLTVSFIQMLKVYFLPKQTLGFITVHKRGGKGEGEGTLNNEMQSKLVIYTLEGVKNTSICSPA